MDGDEVPIDNTTPWPAYTYTPTPVNILVKAMDGAYGGCDWTHCGPECDCVCHDGKCGDCHY